MYVLLKRQRGAVELNGKYMMLLRYHVGSYEKNGDQSRRNATR